MSGLPFAMPAASPSPGRSPRSSASTGGSRAGTVRLLPGGSRLGPRRLAAAERSLSERDRAVLRTVAELRLATSRHLEALHYADAASSLTAARKARRTLQRLVNLGLLRRLERRIGGLHAGSAGYVYALTAAGQRVIEAPGARRRAAEPSLPFVEHTLAIADLYVGLHEVARRSKSDPDQPSVEMLDLQTEPTCWRGWTSLGGDRQLLRPDLYLAAGVGGDELRWFIEIDLGSEHRPALVRKARAYQAYYQAGVEQDRDGLFPRVAWAVPDLARADHLERVLAGEPGLPSELFAVLLLDGAVRELLT